MPAYFNLSLQFRREDLYPDFVKDFFDALELAGLKYLSGYGEAASDSRGEIIQWNQQKLEKDFVLGFTEHFSHGYRQVLYSFREYSEVRGFWMNQYPEKDCFTYEIIIPEEDVLIHEGGEVFQKQHEEAIVELAERLWNFPCIRAIQTGLEGDDASVGLREIELGKMPNMYPFAILEVMYGNEEIEEAVQLKGERMGMAFAPALGFFVRVTWWYCLKGIKGAEGAEQFGSTEKSESKSENHKSRGKEVLQICNRKSARRQKTSQRKLNGVRP